MFFKSFEYLRGIAIVIIVAGHCFGISGWTFHSIPERTIANVISSGTSLFVFISGFLFHQVFYPRFHYTRFLLKKCTKVYLPYLFCASAALVLMFTTKDYFPDNFVGHSMSIWDRYVRPTLLSLLTGGHFEPYWYVPFIMIIFICSPLFIRFIHLHRTTRILLTTCCLIISALVQRPENNIFVPQSVIFFTPIYMVGILCSMEKDWIYSFFAGKILWLIAAVFGLAFLESLVYQGAGSYHSPAFAYNGFDINLFQKLALCLLAMVALNRYEKSENFLLSTLAASSFAIFFIHGWIIWIIGHIEVAHGFKGNSWLLLPMSIFVYAASFGVAWTIKKLTGRYSMMLIGW